MTVNVPEAVSSGGRLYTDKSTKLTYQDVAHPREGRDLLHHPGHRVDGRGDQPPPGVRHGDLQPRAAAAGGHPKGRRQPLGETTNRIIDEYGLPIPETYPRGGSITPANISPTP